MQKVIQKAVSEYRRRQVLKEGNSAYAALQADPAAWAEELQERRVWEETLSDGIENE